MQVRSVLFTLFVTFFALNVSAQVRELDMKTSVALGLQNSPELKQAESHRREVRSQAWQLKSEIFPEISARATSERRMNSGALRTINPATPTPTSQTPFSTYLAALDLKQPIFTATAISGWQLSTARKESAEKEYYAAQQTAVRNLVNAFYDYAAANDFYHAASTNLQTLQSYSQSMTRYAKIGRGREMDRLQASVNASLSDIDSQTALQKQQEAELHFKTLLGLSPNEKISAKFNFEVQSIDPITLDQAVELALKNNPKLILLQEAIRETELKDKIEMAPDLPSLYFLASYGTQALEKDDLFQAKSDFYSYGLSLTIPLFSGFSSVARRREFREQIYQSERAFEIERRNLRERIKNALDNVNRLYKHYESLQVVTKNSQRALDLVNGSFRQGTTTPQDVVNFQSSRYKAEQVLIEIQYTYLKSVAELRELLGVDLLRIYGEKAGAI